MVTNKKSIAILFATVLAFSGCTDDEQPGITSDGIQPSGANEEPSIFGRNSQISEQVATGKFNDGIIVDRPVANAPADNLDVSSTTATDGWNLTNTSNRSVFGTTSYGGSKDELSGAFHMADGTHPSIAKGNSINNVVKADGIVYKAQAELNKRGYRVPQNGVLETETKTGIRKFQKANGLEETGELTQTTLNALSISVTDDNRAPASVE